MANEVTERKSVFGGSVGMLDPDKLASNMGASAALDPRGGMDGMDYMNFSGKNGVFQVGLEKEDVDPEEAWLVNVSSFQDGWICWKGNQPLATRLYDMGVPVPTPNFEEHGPFSDGDGWNQAKAMVLRSIDAGNQCYWKISSKSGVSVMAALQRDVKQRIVSGLPYWPVVKLNREKFTAKNKTNWKPVVTIMGWLDTPHVEQLAEMFDDEDATLDLDKMFAESATGGTLTPPKVETKAAPAADATVAVKRNRRAGV